MKKRFVAIIVAIVLFWGLEGSNVLRIWILRVVGVLSPTRVAIQESSQQQVLLARIADLEKEQQKSAAISGKIIFGGGFLFSDTLMINKGSEDEVKTGDWIIAYGTMVGRVESASPHTSSVVPLSRFKERVTLRLGLKKDIALEGEGVGGGEIQIELPQGIGVAVGDLAWWGEESDYVIGLVNTVDAKEGRSVNYAYIRSPFSLRSLTDITIVKNPL